ncbi:branched-chain amino acid ABC transporter ATP-binding protein/permease [Teichococcus vastitatis]|uniref:branched-chain amino acid ABC transporter ATP-binding protein/permease n=1 Tax=Teichococcus vastitatis TaxID=2307076 RepID=UPI00192E5256|nr:branched-chain amino acid ABC transporter ATP-binding protein/permease [Pseudoroseomonas vastitatis]
MSIALPHPAALLREPPREDPPPPRQPAPSDAVPASLRWLLPWTVLFLAMLVPMMPGLSAGWMLLLCQAGIAALVVLGLVVLTGAAGLGALGQAMFVGIGAYASALATTRWGLSPWLGLGAALLSAGMAGALVGAVTLRLRRHYLAIATLAWNVAFVFLLGRVEGLGHLEKLPPVVFLTLDFATPWRFYALVLAALVAAVAMTSGLLHGRMGRALHALRGGSRAAEALGINSFHIRMSAFIYAAVLAGLAGWLQAHLDRGVSAGSFGVDASLNYLLMAVVGGSAHIAGALLGAALWTALHAPVQPWLPPLLGTGGDVDLVLSGGLLLLLLHVAPGGLWPLLRHPFRRWLAPPEPEAAVLPPGETLPARPHPRPGAELLRATGLRKRFGGVLAVDGVGLTVKAGEIVGLIGPNGAGKSTTFDLLCGVIPPCGGDGVLLGQPLRRAAPRRLAAAGLARSFQTVHLVPGLTVFENVLLGTHLRGRAGVLRGMLGLDQREEAVLHAEAWRQIDRVGLTPYAHRIACQLPLGRRRLVEIARALCLDPAVLLLDEPAAGLRPRDRAELMDLLDDLRRDGLGLVLVEHDMDFVMRLTDRLVVMNFGTELAQGTPREIRRNPAVIEAYLGGVA